MRIASPPPAIMPRYEMILLSSLLLWIRLVFARNHQGIDQNMIGFHFQSQILTYGEGNIAMNLWHKCDKSVTHREKKVSFAPSPLLATARAPDRPDVIEVLPDAHVTVTLCERRPNPLRTTSQPFADDVLVNDIFTRVRHWFHSKNISALQNTTAGEWRNYAYKTLCSEHTPPRFSESTSRIYIGDVDKIYIGEVMF